MRAVPPAVASLSHECPQRVVGQPADFALFPEAIGLCPS